MGGALADRVSRRAILVVGPLAQAVVLAAVGLAVRVGGMCSGVILGAGTPALRRIVPDAQMAAANVHAMSRDMAAQPAGPPLGGLLFAAGRAVPFLVDALSFVCAALGALNIRRPLGPDREATEARTTLLQDIGQGIGFVRSRPFLRFVVVMTSLLNMVDQAFVMLLVGLVGHRGSGPVVVGVISGVAVAGALAGSLSVSADPPDHFPAAAVPGDAQRQPADAARLRTEEATLAPETVA